jgi:hypothetical protein
VAAWATAPTDRRQIQRRSELCEDAADERLGFRGWPDSQRCCEHLGRSTPRFRLVRDAGLEIEVETSRQAVRRRAREAGSRPSLYERNLWIFLDTIEHDVVAADRDVKIAPRSLLAAL